MVNPRQVTRHDIPRGRTYVTKHRSLGVDLYRGLAIIDRRPLQDFSGPHLSICP